MKKFYTLFLLFMISTLLNAQNYKWEWQNPKPHGNDIGDVKYFSKDTVIAAAGAGYILKSIDGGSKWTLIKADTSSRDILSVYFWNKSKGVICGMGGLLMQTKDAGQSWTYLTSGSTEDLYDVKFVDADTGYIAGSKGTILKTKDGGKTWTASTAGTATNYKIFIVNASDIFIGTGTKDNKLLRSVDYGKTWTNVAPASYAYNIYAIAFTDSLTGYFGSGNNDIYKSTDGGKTWTKKTTASASVNIYDIQFTSKTAGYAVDAKGTVFSTTDAGETWTSAKVPFQKFSAVDGDSSALYIAGVAGAILRSDDKGKTWTPKYTAVVQNYLREIKFVDAKTGYACGGSATSSDSLGYILKTTDGGANWTMLANEFKSQVYTFEVITPTLWCAAGSGNGLYRSTNGGVNWTKITSPVTTANMVFYSIVFAGKDTGYVAGNSGNILKTIDGGQTWTKLTTKTSTGTDVIGTSTIWDISIFDSKTIIVSAIQGKVGKTADGGLTWEAQAPNIAGSLNVLKFKDDLTGYVGGVSKALSRTTDGGKTWTAVDLPTAISTSSSIWGIAFGKTTEWIVTSKGEICYSKDNGKTWNVVNNNTTVDLYNIEAFGDTVWVVGNNGIILKGTPDKVDAVKHENSAVVSRFSLDQNYPNPFNPSTTIRYSTPKAGWVNLKVYNLIGKEVAQLVNSDQAAGTHIVKFDASNLSSGIYFYELRMGGNITTRKMLLLK